MGIDVHLYAGRRIHERDSFEVKRILHLSGKEGLLLANWFYNFYHKQNSNYLEESTEFIICYIDEITTLHEHLIKAMEGDTHLIPIYPLAYDDLLYIKPDSKEYYRLISNLYDKIHYIFYDNNQYNDDVLFYRICW